MDIYTEINAKLNKLKMLDTNKKIFGAEKHNYILNPTLTDNQLLEFEQKHEISLPEDYKLFLLAVGNGGAGPYYGMFSLENYFDSRHYGIEINKRFLSTPFPFSSKMPYAYVDESDELLVQEMTGSITLSHQGCGYFDMLIIAGDERGSVWTDARCSDGGMDKINYSFIDWYCEWLDKSIAKCSV